MAESCSSESDHSAETTKFLLWNSSNDEERKNLFTFVGGQYLKIYKKNKELTEELNAANAYIAELEAKLEQALNQDPPPTPGTAPETGSGEAGGSSSVLTKAARVAGNDAGTHSLEGPSFGFTLKSEPNEEEEKGATSASGEAFWESGLCKIKEEPADHFCNDGIVESGDCKKEGQWDCSNLLEFYEMMNNKMTDLDVQFETEEELDSDDDADLQ